MAKSTRKKAYHHGDLRTTILEAAVSLIAERGLHGLSLRECARRAGVSHAAPYRHFQDKNALLLAIAREGFDGLAEAGEQAMLGITDPPVTIKNIENAIIDRAFAEGWVKPEPPAQLAGVFP